MNKKPLSGKVAAVTGAGRGMGRAIALPFSRAGANLAICSRSIDELNEVKSSSEAHGMKCLVGIADLTDPNATEAFCKAAIDEFGKLDVLVNNAGVEMESSKVEDSDPERSWKTAEVNIRGPYLVTRFFLRGLAEGAKIINISSGLGRRAADWNSSYSVSKAGVHIFSEVLANELWPRKIDVNNLIPGPVATDMFNRDTRGVRYTPEENLERFAKEPPPGFPPQERIKHPDEVAELALYMATRPIGGPTGQTFSLGRRPFWINWIKDVVTAPFPEGRGVLLHRPVQCHPFGGVFALHVHLLVKYPPRVSLSRLVNSLKGVSSRRLRSIRPEIIGRYRKGVPWSPSYFAASSGGDSLDIFRRFVEEQHTIWDPR